MQPEGRGPADGAVVGAVAAVAVGAVAAVAVGAVAGWAAGHRRIGWPLLGDRTAAA